MTAANTLKASLERETESIKIAEERIATLEVKLEVPVERHLKAV